ncbi:hypothetical protein HPT29_006340 [Microvirga terrae]|uniref:Uncharacterized protein n=1 Tax=Microvirga terrae TaxID=2740529 RepID=A0ABY5RU18_9HYPH|nr:hypothetical protein [Microvirga terrae]UVF20740.1 hypothetical protein HPT29_006340 [Microvirga terrae]
MLNKAPKLAISVAAGPDRYKKGAACAAPLDVMVACHVMAGLVPAISVV